MLKNVTLLTVSEPVRVRRGAPRTWTEHHWPPVAVAVVHPLAVARALELAGGDRSRLRFEPDGSVLVSNHRRVR